jgi:hypothetical protein
MVFLWALLWFFSLIGHDTSSMCLAHPSFSTLSQSFISFSCDAVATPINKTETKVEETTNCVQGISLTCNIDKLTQTVLLAILIN